MLQTWAENGTPMLSLGDRLFKFAGVANVGWDFTGGAQSGTITDGRFTQYPNCVPFAFSIRNNFDNRGGGVQLSISGNTLTWSYPYPETDKSYKRPNTQFVYGIF